ncbi:MAG: elongation factor P [Planctomycetales bacterium]|nr:elongation factor P [Planctomycetales bacterium]
MIAKDIKPGAIVVHNGQPCMVKGVTVQTPSARGAATIYKYRAMNLISKQKADFSLKGGESLDEADFQRRPVTYMYSDATHVHLLDQQDYNQHALPLDLVADEVPYLTEALEGVFALIYNEQCVGVQLPVTVEMKIIECEPRVKGDSATSRNKPATVETGLVVPVPEYLSEGEVIKIDTRTGEFLGRA